jgi:hypothetical protein
LVSPLSKRLLAAILLVSSLTTAIFTALSFYLDYKDEISALNKAVEQIKARSVNSPTSSLYIFDTNQMQIQPEGIVSIPEISNVKITDHNKNIIASAGGSEQ